MFLPRAAERIKRGTARKGLSPVLDTKTLLRTGTLAAWFKAGWGFHEGFCGETAWEQAALRRVSLPRLLQPPKHNGLTLHIPMGYGAVGFPLATSEDKPRRDERLAAAMATEQWPDFN